MTIPPEVLAAAERRRGFTYRGRDKWVHLDGTTLDGEEIAEFDRELAQDLIALIASQQAEAAERGKLIDEKWLKSIGFEFDRYGMARFATLAVGVSGYAAGVWYLNGNKLDANLWPTTRGELLDLLAALKVEVKGGA